MSEKQAKVFALLSMAIALGVAFTRTLKKDKVPVLRPLVGIAVWGATALFLADLNPTAGAAWAALLTADSLLLSSDGADLIISFFSPKSLATTATTPPAADQGNPNADVGPGGAAVNNAGQQINAAGGVGGNYYGPTATTSNYKLPSTIQTTPPGTHGAVFGF